MSAPGLVDCPECGLPAEVVGWFTHDSTAGPVDHVRLRCLGFHPALAFPASMLVWDPPAAMRDEP